MNKRKVWLWIVGVVILAISGAIVAWLGILVQLPWQSGKVYEDPQGRFTINVDQNWKQVETSAPYTLFQLPDPPMHI